MGRHRIEIEFDADAEDAEAWFDWISEEATCHTNLTIEMTPVITKNDDRVRVLVNRSTGASETYLVRRQNPS